ncbi:MAG: aminopeptidase [Gammaproteobacteria bacterium]
MTTSRPSPLPGLALRAGVVGLLAVALLAGCAGYYLQAVAGQAAVMRARKPLEQVLADPGTAPDLRRQLLLVDGALLFARLDLGLPATKSYRHYADLGRPFVVWNVFAAPEFSLEPREWCYPVAGCTAYRGWFDEARARDSARDLEARGDDVYVGGVAAYSTLGWLADPVLNTMLGDDDAGLAGLLFHELAHQRFYLPGDTPFNEGFATLVEEEGARRWLELHRDAPGLCNFQLQRTRRASVLGIIAELRKALERIYASGAADSERRQQRSAAFDVARQDYARLRVSWPAPPYFDGWFAPGLNNARLAALASYEELVPAFRALLAREGGDLPRFYRNVEALGGEPPEARAMTLEDLVAAGAPEVSGSAAAGSGCRGGY